MDLIYMNTNREDVGVLMDYELDLAFGADENNFECRIHDKSHCCEAGYYLYAEGTEYGGIIDNIESNTAYGEVVYSGRTWHGILNSKVIEPDAGKSHLVLSGEANAVIASLISRLKLSTLFTASEENSGLNIGSYKMSRYIAGYDGIRKMLAAFDAKLRVTFRDGVVVLSAVARRDYSRDEEFDSDQLGMRVKRYHKPVNHLLCLGGGEGVDRLVVHLYADTDGNISRAQTQTGLDEVSAIYEYSSITSEDELVAEGTDRLKALLAADEVSVDFDADSDAYDIGDVVGAHDNITGLYISTTIRKKIVTIKNGKVTISLAPDTEKSAAPQVTGGGGGTSGGGGGESITIVSVSESTEDGGKNIVTFSDGSTVTVRNGSKGSKGDPGKDGVSPVISVSDIEGGHRITVTDAAGTKTLDVMDGTDGSPGAAGADGYTPQKGVDYFTAADKGQIVSEVIAGLPTGTVTNAVTLSTNQTITGIKTFAASNLFDGEQKLTFGQYCPTVTDIASGIGASMKNARAVDCQLYVAEVYAPYWASTATHGGKEPTSGLTATVGQIDFYVITGAASGQPTGRKLIMQMKEDGLYVLGKKVKTE